MSGWTSLLTAGDLEELREALRRGWVTSLEWEAPALRLRVRVPPEARVVEREIREDGETGFSAAYIRWVMPLKSNAVRHGRRRRT